LTLDKGIADVREQRHAGVVLFRPDSAGRRAVLSFVRERISMLASMDLGGRVTVVGASRIRVRWDAIGPRLPKSVATVRGMRLGPSKEGS
jgi:hypothetical protein